MDPVRSAIGAYFLKLADGMPDPQRATVKEIQAVVKKVTGIDVSKREIRDLCKSMGVKVKAATIGRPY